MCGARATCTTRSQPPASAALLSVTAAAGSPSHPPDPESCSPTHLQPPFPTVSSPSQTPPTVSGAAGSPSSPGPRLMFADAPSPPSPSGSKGGGSMMTRADSDGPNASKAKSILKKGGGALKVRGVGLVMHKGRLGRWRGQRAMGQRPNSLLKKGGGALQMRGVGLEFNAPTAKSTLNRGDDALKVRGLDVKYKWAGWAGAGAAGQTAAPKHTAQWAVPTLSLTLKCLWLSPSDVHTAHTVPVPSGVQGWAGHSLIQCSYCPHCFPAHTGVHG